VHELLRCLQAAGRCHVNVAFFDKSSPYKKLGALIIVGNGQHVQLRLVELT
jgi:hypothetical protein